MGVETIALAAGFGLLVGLSLGLTGGGGSILAVPLLVYGLDMDLRTAVALSLVIVGATSLFGAAIQARSGQVLWRAGAILGIGGIAIAPFGAIVGAGMNDDVVVIMFAALMVIVGIQMLRGASGSEVGITEENAGDPDTESKSSNVGSAVSCRTDNEGLPIPTSGCIAKLLAAGAATGFLSGLFGVGGGFLLVPALLLVGGVSMHHALATSLVAIALTSVSGFISNVGAAETIPVATAVIFAVGSLIGMQSGAYLKNYLPAKLLRTGFAFAVVAVGGFMVVTTLA